MKECVKCKKEYPDDMVFCSYCGITLQPKIQESVCPACGKVVHADNLRFCPYCGEKIEFSKTANITINAKPIDNGNNHLAQGNVCPACGKLIHAKNLNSCPYCGGSLKDNSMNNNDQALVNTNKPLESSVNIKKNYVKMQPLNQETNPSTNEASKSDVNKSVSTTESNESSSGNSESSSGGFLKTTLTIIGVVFLMGFSKACGKILYHGTTGYQKGFFIGVVFAGIVGGIIPALVAYKCCKFDNPSTAVWSIFILQIIVSFLSAYQIVPIGSIPIGIILAILLYLFNKK